MDQIVLGAAAIGAAVGFWQGAVKQVANTIGVLAGVVLAAMFHRQCAGLVAQWTGTEGGTAQALAFLIIVVAVPIGLGIAATLLTMFLKVVRLNFLNRLMGAAVGAACYGLLAFFATYIMNQWSLNP